MPPPPPIIGMPPPPPPPPGPNPPPPPPLASGFQTWPAKAPAKKKKTVRLFWKEAHVEPPSYATLKRKPTVAAKSKDEGDSGTIWSNISPIAIDTRKFEHLFESRSKDFQQKQKAEAGKKNFITVLDPKRSNAINIGLTVLPQPRTIKQAILTMDTMVINKEGVEKLLTMMPTEEEVSAIQEATTVNPDVPLASAEQFLQMMASISGLKARLSLWLFKADYDSLEEEVAEPLADLKKGMEDLKDCKTFRYILATLLAIGNFLNGAQAQGFHIDYLSKVPLVKDTVHKQSLLYHAVQNVMEKFQDSTDLFSELGNISRCAKVDFEQVAENLITMEEECKASWEHLRVISKYDGGSPLKNKLQEFLGDCAKRIIVLKIVHRRVCNRFNNLLLYLGMSESAAREITISDFCRIIAEFALEYRTTRERVLEAEKKKANHRKRCKTRGKMITENLTLSEDKDEDKKLKDFLLSKNHGTAPGDTGSMGRSRSRGKSPSMVRSSTANNLDEAADEHTDEMIQVLVNSAKNPRNRMVPRERRRARQTNRKSLRRTLKSGLTEAETKALGLAPKSGSGMDI
ncbi:FH1/FH2 domain-containing protein 3-like [Amphiura filiformis]|uniref:FH1/FH2 domain-containing protein 3-like n=1 Tax=Amphiura filiformis TaxID=82378 RepID=UPI003B211A46